MIVHASRHEQEAEEEEVEKSLHVACINKRIKNAISNLNKQE